MILFVTCRRYKQVEKVLDSVLLALYKKYIFLLGICLFTSQNVNKIVSKTCLPGGNVVEISEWTKATHVAHHSWKALEHTFINTDLVVNMEKIRRKWGFGCAYGTCHVKQHIVNSFHDASWWSHDTTSHRVYLFEQRMWMEWSAKLENPQKHWIGSGYWTNELIKFCPKFVTVMYYGGTISVRLEATWLFLFFRVILSISHVRVWV